MQVNRLFNKMWNLYETLETNLELLDWIKAKLSTSPYNIDYNYMHLEVLNIIDFDNDREHEEPNVINLCTEIIKSKENHSDITVAKAYTYRGEMKFLGIDRRKDFDKAKLLLQEIDNKNSEKKFLLKMIEEAYPLNRRQYLNLHPKDFRNQI